MPFLYTLKFNKIHVYLNFSKIPDRLASTGFKCTLGWSATAGKCINFGILPVQVHFGNGWHDGEMDVPERSMEKLFALAGGPEGVGKNGGVRFSAVRRSFFDFRGNKAIDA